MMTMPGLWLLPIVDVKTSPMHCQWHASGYAQRTSHLLVGSTIFLSVAQECSQLELEIQQPQQFSTSKLLYLIVEIDKEQALI